METIRFLFLGRLSWLILLTALVALWIAISNIRSAKHSGARISIGLDTLLYLSGAAIVLGCLGYFMEMKSSLCLKNVLPGGSFVTIICTVTDSAEKMRDIATCYLKSAASMMTGLLMSLLFALTWLLLHRYTRRS